MTEEEAKTKWCPMYRQSISIDGSNREWADNRMDGSNPTCIGSACMAWRSKGEPVERYIAYTPGYIPEGEGWRCTLTDEGRQGFQVKSMWERDAPPQGYCGLAGKP